MKRNRLSPFLAALPFSVAALFLSGPESSFGAAQTWANTGTDFNTGGSWLSGTAPVTSGTAVFATGATTQPNLSSSLSLAFLSFSTASSTGYNFTSSSTSTVLTLTGASALTLATNSGSNTFSLPIVLGANAGTTQTITVNSGAAMVMNGVIGTTNSINVGIAGSGTLRLNAANTFSGTITQSGGGIIVLGNSGALGSSVLNMTSNSDQLRAGVDLTGANKINNNLIWAANVTISDSPGFGMEFGGTVDLAGAGRTITNSNSAGTTFNGVISNDLGGGVTLQANANLLTLKGTNTYTGNTTILGSGTVSVASIGNAGANGNLGAGSAINFGGTSSTGRLVYTGAGETTSKTINLSGTSGGAIIDQSGTAGLLKFSSFSATGTGSKTLTLQGSTAGAGEISGIITDPSAGVVSVTKAGSGTWTLSNANTYTGTTTISAGALVLNHANAAQNSVVAVNVSNGLLFGTASGTYNLGGLTGSGNVNLVDTSSASLGALNIGGNNASTAFSGSLIGSSAVNKVGTGNLTLSGTSSGFSGNVTVASGTLSSSTNANNFGTGTVYLGDTGGSANATLAFNQVTGGGTPNTIVVQSGNTGTATISTIGNATNVLSGTVVVNKNLFVTTSGSGGITFGSSSTAEVLTGTADLTFNGNSNSLSTVSGSNSNFTGGVVINSGTVKLSSNNGSGLLAARAVAVNSGNFATLQVANSASIRGLNDGANGGGMVSSGTAASSQTLTLTGTGSYSFSGSLVNSGSGTLAVTKSGAGTQVFGGTNSYSGATSVTAGTLLINGFSSSSAITVSNTNTVLGGTGTIAPGASHTLAVSTGAAVAPGTDGTLGTLTVSLNNTGDAASFATGARFKFDLNSPGSNDVLAFTGLTLNVADVTFNNNAVDFTNLGGLAVGSYTLFTFDQAGAYSGTLSIGTGLGPATGNFSYNANSIVFNVTSVPEPGTVALSGLGIAGMLYMLRRRRS